jgi:2-keto-4-pentenoate hydratase/2-oxohepta-3-ene-1,7-dioic acid hydratase in catechol pathway
MMAFPISRGVWEQISGNHPRKAAGHKFYTASMRFLTFEQGGLARPGVLAGSDTVVDLSLVGCHSLLELISGSDEWMGKASRLSATSPEDARHKLSDVKLMAPIPKPRKLICVGLNYRDHALETNSEIPSVPTIFSKFATAVIGPGDNIVLPKVSKMPDYEAEFAFVIGKGGRHIKAEDWRSHIFGYTIVNDVSARDYQKATSQWLMGKTFDTFAPMGPWIVTADEIEDPHALDIQLEIDGEMLQNSNTRELIFKIPELIAFLSSVFTLEPGDIVSTGTPSGVGVARKPQRFLKPNESVTVRIPAIGELTNPTVAEL